MIEYDRLSITLKTWKIAFY